MKYIILKPFYMFNKLIASSLAVFMLFGAYNKSDYLSSENTIIQGIIKNINYSNFLGKNFDFCNFALLPALPKLACKLLVPAIKEAAITTDTENINFTLNKQLRSSILELATVKDDYYFSVNSSYTTTLLGIESETTVNASFKAKVKCGFDLKNSFDITVEHENKKIIIIFPRPTILSNEVTMINSTVDEGVFSRRVGIATSNEIIESAKAKAIEYANRSNIKEDAKKNVSKAIYDSLPPLTSSQFGYNLVIVFQDENLKINQGK